MDDCGLRIKKTSHISGNCGLTIADCGLKKRNLYPLFFFTTGFFLSIVNPQSTIRNSKMG
jgi:hypothetical protein